MSREVKKVSIHYRTRDKARGRHSPETPNPLKQIYASAMVLLDLGSSSCSSRNFPTLTTATGRRISACCRTKNGARKLEFLSLASVRIGLMAAAAVTATTLLLSTSNQAAAALQFQDSETLSNIPPSLSGEICSSDTPTCKKPLKIQRPKSRKAETCTVKCLNTCIRGGDGSPGEGPFTIRRPIVVFKSGFRSRQYCLAECSDICNLLGDKDDGP